MAPVTLILTVLNEAESVGELLDSLLAQSRPPDEIVVVDGGSTDGTVRHLERYAAHRPLRVIVEPGAGISRGRNAAIAAASHALAGRRDEAQRAMSRLRRLDPGLRMSNVGDWLPIRRPEDRAMLALGLQKAGLPP